MFFMTPLSWLRSYFQWSVFLSSVCESLLCHFCAIEVCTDLYEERYHKMGSKLQKTFLYMPILSFLSLRSSKEADYDLTWWDTPWIQHQSIYSQFRERVLTIIMEQNLMHSFSLSKKINEIACRKMRWVNVQVLTHTFFFFFAYRHSSDRNKPQIVCLN